MPTWPAGAYSYWPPECKPNPLAPGKIDKYVPNAWAGHMRLRNLDRVKRNKKCGGWLEAVGHAKLQGPQGHKESHGANSFFVFFYLGSGGKHSFKCVLFTLSSQGAELSVA